MTRELGIGVTISVFLDLSVHNLGPMYTTHVRKTDRQTDTHQKSHKSTA